MALILTVNGVDKTNQFDWRAFSKETTLTKQPDTLKLRVKNYGTKTYRPALNDQVILTLGGTRVFGGVVISGRETIAGLALFYEIVCKDFSQTLDRIMVNKVYTGQTGNAIVADMLTNFTLAAEGFTGTNVVCPDTVPLIVFNYVTMSVALQKLCDYLGNYSWYVDYNKDIHIFKNSTVLAPFNITDTSANLVFGSLEVNQDFSQVRNHIFLQGGDVSGTPVQNDQVADGQQLVFFVGYNLTTFTAFHALAASPTVFNPYSVGRDGIDNPTSFDCLYNPDQGLLIFPVSLKPAANDIVRYAGIPVFPLLAEKIDAASVTLYGEYQALITDKSIQSLPAASQKLGAELLKNSLPVTTAKFQTQTDGLVVGQQININSVIRNVNKNFVIQRIRVKLATPSTFIYDVEAVAVNMSVTGILDALDKLLVTTPSDNLVTVTNPVVQKLVSATETITLAEVVAVSISHNAKAETVTMTEALFVQPLNYVITSVCGPYTPTVAVNGADHKRVMLLDGGRVS